MTSETSPYPKAPQTTPTAERSGWTGSDLAIGGALVVLLIALFLPWFSAPGIASTDGPSSHGYLWLAFVLTILALIVLVARDAIAQLPGNLPSPEQMLVGATGLALLLTILGVAQSPSRVAGNLGSSWSYGGWVALVAALIAVIAALRETGALKSGNRPTLASLRRRGSSA